MIVSYPDGASEGILDRYPLCSSVSCEESGRLLPSPGLITRIAQSIIFPLSAVWRACHHILLKREHWVGKELFWTAPFEDLRYPKQKEVRDLFCRYNQKIILQVKEGEAIEVNCRIIETKGCPKTGVLNHVLVQGNASTLDNNMPGVYPLLEAYIKAQERGEQLPPARFILVNHYANSAISPEGEKEYYPSDVHEWGFFFKKVLQEIVKEYGSLHLLLGHSLGTVPVVECFKHMSDEEMLELYPKTLFIAQGPSSLYEVSGNLPVAFQWYPWGRFFLIGWIAYQFFKWMGWDIQLDTALVQRFQAASHHELLSQKLRRSHIIITGVEHDVFFPGKASLCSSDQLDQLKGIVNLSRLLFNPPLSWGVPRAQHNYNIGWLQRQDLVKEKLDYIDDDQIDMNHPLEIVHSQHEHTYALQHGESVVDAVLRSAWPVPLADKQLAVQ